ncbi:MAG: peroxiredoxin family protein [Terriglobales bacterium]
MKWVKNIFGGPNMTALTAGKRAPDFSLPNMEGKDFSLRDALASGPVVAAFFKVSCPVCQYAFPFLDRIYKNYGGRNVTFVGISQNDKKDTAAFMKQFGVTFPVLLDAAKTFPVSNAYGLTNVPSVFWIEQDGEIQISSIGWNRQEIEEIARKAREATGESPKLVFRPDEKIVDFRAG